MLPDDFRYKLSDETVLGPPATKRKSIGKLSRGDR
jgi:hypothetical protein